MKSSQTQTGREVAKDTSQKREGQVVHVPPRALMPVRVKLAPPATQTRGGNKRTSDVAPVDHRSRRRERGPPTTSDGSPPAGRSLSKGATPKQGSPAKKARLAPLCPELPVSPSPAPLALKANNPGAAPAKHPRAHETKAEIDKTLSTPDSVQYCWDTIRIATENIRGGSEMEDSVLEDSARSS